MASSGSGSPREEEEHRMMASTTVFVLEPGVTALGNHQQAGNGGDDGGGGPDGGNGDGEVERTEDGGFHL